MRFKTLALSACCVALLGTSLLFAPLAAAAPLNDTVKNVQNTGAPVSSILNNTSLTVLNNATNGTTAVATVSDNQLLVQAMGTSAENTINVISLPVTGASTLMIINRQTVTAPVDAKIANVTLGVTATPNKVDTVMAAVNNNTLTAVAVGNSAVNKITTH